MSELTTIRAQPEIPFGICVLFQRHSVEVAVNVLVQGSRYQKRPQAWAKRIHWKWKKRVVNLIRRSVCLAHVPVKTPTVFS